eukprot:gene5361-5897_t
MTRKVIKCVLSGGPCAGKSTAIVWLREALRQRGAIVFTVPETSTLLRTNGAVYPGLGEENKGILLAYELTLLSLQLKLEESMLAVSACEAALLGPEEAPVVLLLDRAILDIKAYVSPEVWQAMLAGSGLTEEAILSRYDVVCHLHTTALGAEEHYTVENNTARTEGLAEAKEVDGVTWTCWSQHPQHHVIANPSPSALNHSNTFQVKLDTLLQTIMPYVS